MSHQKHRMRAPGAGRKRATELFSDLVSDLEKLVTLDNPRTAEPIFDWSPLSTIQLTRELIGLGYDISQRTVCDILGKLGYNLTSSGRNSNDKLLDARIAQFEYLSTLIKNYSGSSGRAYAFEFTSHFTIAKDLDCNKGRPQRLSLDHAGVAAHSLAAWLKVKGVEFEKRGPGVLIVIDYKDYTKIEPRKWKEEFQFLADALQVNIKLSCVPPGTVRWNARDLLSESHLKLADDVRLRVAIHSFSPKKTNAARLPSRPQEVPHWWNLEVYCDPQTKS